MHPVQLPDVDALTEAADSVGAAVDGFDQVVIDVQSAWSGLSSSYSAPESGVVVQAMAGLGPVRDELDGLAADAATALRNYATEIAALATRRSAIVSDIADYRAQPADPSNPYRWQEIEADIVRFDADAEAADADCAGALSALHRYYTWSIADALDIATGAPGGALQGLAAELLMRYRDLWVPQPGATLPDIPRLDQIIPDEFINGKPYVHLPSGLVVPLGSNLPDAPATIAKPPGWSTHPTLTGNPALTAPPTWARWGGRTLNAVGAGLTYWGTYTDRYNETLVEHSEWTDDQRVQSSVVHSAVEGTASVAGGMGGAWAGAAGGAALGTLIAPGVGTVIGGIVGGVVGGIAGGEIGGWLGGLGLDLWGD